jgi:hypothetical protein
LAQAAVVMELLLVEALQEQTQVHFQQLQQAVVVQVVTLADYIQD